MDIGFIFFLAAIPRKNEIFRRLVNPEHRLTKRLITLRMLKRESPCEIAGPAFELKSPCFDHEVQTRIFITSNELIFVQKAFTAF